MCDSLFAHHPMLQPRSNNDSWNHNDEEGTHVFWIAVAAVVVLSVGALVGIARRPVLGLLFAAMGVVLLGVAVAGVVQKPIRGLYAVSQLWTRSVRTPPVLAPFEITPETCQQLSDQYHAVRAEVLAFVDSHRLALTSSTYGNEYIGKDRVGEEGWRVFMVKLGNHFPHIARRNVPSLCRALEDRPEIVSCLVSVLPPGVHIPPHVGYSKAVQRLMLALEVPREEGCFLCVNGEKLRWEEGRFLAFDDTFPHTVQNNTSERRVVLYMDVLRKDVSPFLDWLAPRVVSLVQATPYLQEEIKKTEEIVPNGNP